MEAVASALAPGAAAAANPASRLRPRLPARDRAPGPGQPRGSRERPGCEGLHVQHRAGGLVPEAQCDRHRGRLQGRALHGCRRSRLRVLRHDADVPDQRPGLRGRRERPRHVGSDQAEADRQAPDSGDGHAARVARSQPAAGHPGGGGREPDDQRGRHRRVRHLPGLPRAGAQVARRRSGFLGHESGLAPDGRTFYSASPVERDARRRGHLEPVASGPDLDRQLRLPRAVDPRRRQPGLRRRRRVPGSSSSTPPRSRPACRTPPCASSPGCNGTR